MSSTDDKPTASDFFGGLGNGLLSLVGLGNLCDPLGDATSDFNTAMSNMSAMQQAQSLSSIQGITATMGHMLNFIRSKDTLLSDSIKNGNLILSNDLKQEQLFLSVTAMIVFLLIVFFLIQKRCC